MGNSGLSPSIGGFTGIRRKALEVSPLGLVKSSVINADGLPLVIEPAIEGVDLADWAASNHVFVQTELAKHGAVLFRGFSLPAIADFERVAGAIYEELYGGYGDLPREGDNENIYTSTPYPEDKTILFHSESAHLPSWPMKISFFCLIPSRDRGETPILDNRRVCQRMRPALLDQFERKGLKYVRNFIEGVDVSWRQFFRTEDKSVVEARCQRENLDCEWTANDGLRISQRTIAVAHHPRTGEKVFFNQIQLHHISCLEAVVRESLLSIMPVEDLPRNVYFGDGSTIEDQVMEEIGELYWNLATVAPWEKHDVIVVDNMLVSHARNPYSGPRRIAVAMGDMISLKAVQQRSVL